MTDDLSLDLFDDEAPGEQDRGSREPAGEASISSETPPTVWTVSQVNRAVRGLLEQSVEEKDVFRQGLLTQKRQQFFDQFVAELKRKLQIK